MFLKKLFLILFSLLGLTSCVENLEFSQIEDYRFTPEYTSSLTYFTILPKHFFNELGVQETERTEISDFQIFKDNFVKENVLKLDFIIEISNEYNNSFTVQIEFLDVNNNSTYQFNEIKVAANNLDYSFKEVVLLNSTNIKNTNKVRVTVKIDDAAIILDSNDTSEFKFKSSVNVYIDTDA